MKLTYLNKTVEINIPLTTKRLKQQVLEDFFDSYKDADIPAYENEEFLFESNNHEELFKKIVFLSDKENHAKAVVKITDLREQFLKKGII